MFLSQQQFIYTQWWLTVGITNATKMTEKVDIPFSVKP